MNAQVALKGRFRNCCAKESSRWAIAAVQIQPHNDGALAIATDGKLMAIEKADVVEGKLDEPVLVPSSIVPNTRGGGTIELNGRAEHKGKVAEYAEGAFPQWHDGILPDLNATVMNTAEPLYPTAICLDAELLFNLAKAIGRNIHDAGGTVVTLFLPKDGKRAIGVMGHEGGIGALMPVNPCLADRQPPESAFQRMREDYTALKADVEG